MNFTTYLCQVSRSPEHKASCSPVPASDPQGPTLRHGHPCWPSPWAHPACNSARAVSSAWNASLPSQARQSPVSRSDLRGRATVSFRLLLPWAMTGTPQNAVCTPPPSAPASSFLIYGHCLLVHCPHHNAGSLQAASVPFSFPSLQWPAFMYKVLNNS